jgi:hypothetical protein
MGDKSGGGYNMPLETGPTPIARAFYSFLTLMDQLDEIDEFHFGDLERALEQRVEQPRLETMQKMLMAYVGRVDPCRPDHQEAAKEGSERYLYEDRVHLV